ncbi:hypothetical protein [Caldivirga sp.]
MIRLIKDSGFGVDWRIACSASLVVVLTFIGAIVEAYLIVMTR